MTSYQYHMEALRKQRVLERKQEALRRQAMANEDAQKIGNSLQYRTQMNDGNMSLEPDNRSYRSTLGKLGVVNCKPIHHRNTDNTPVDRMYPMLHPDEFLAWKPNDNLPSRVKHFKV
ncbi:uncharacterized protein LOC141903963 isoform X3 [Tubulanus polymorphus]|uniref:uncharacterized protein LOC141903963 isoform X3 n=1 Tax=Tubulanus polymorphus TaxID=672921 RepID=UPI003DA4E17C